MPEPYWQDASLTVYQGDALAVLAEMPAESVNCVVTSPPYWGLRDYGIEPTVWGGDPAHVHEWGAEGVHQATTGGTARSTLGTASGGHAISADGIARSIERQVVAVTSAGAFCQCGAWLGNLGLEPTPDAYVANLVAVFREVRRVLRKDGTVWLNLGDSYAGYWGDKTAKREGRPSSANTNGWTNGFNMDAKPDFHAAFDGSRIKPKDLVGIPWRVAFALQADGWYLRSDVIWSKPNPMPESVTDRPTKAHEYVFLLTKSARYFYDADAVREEGSGLSGGGFSRATAEAQLNHGAMRLERPEVVGRNLRSVWTIPTQPYPGAHFATFPPKLIEPMVLAGCPLGGVVLDPFGGSGTTGLVAGTLGRKAILIDLNADYIRQSIVRASRGLADPGGQEVPDDSLWSLAQ